MRASLVVVSMCLMACKSSDRRAAPPPADAADPAVARAAGLTGCIAALQAAPPPGALDGGLAALLAGCTPCGVSWQPLVALSTTDPDAREPGALPGPDEVLAVLDACGATCTGSARSAVTEALRSAQLGKSPSAPWRKIGEACHAALRLDDRTRRYARGSWYALDQLARALWSPDAPPEVVAARDARSRAFPLPPFSEASTALALPRVDHVADGSPRLHVTITVDKLHVGGLPFAVLRDGAVALVPADQDYPGPEVALADVQAALDDAATRYGGPDRAANLANAPVLIAPRGMVASRLLEVLAEMSTAQAYLAGTPREPRAGAWPEPVAAIPVMMAAAKAPGVEHVELPAGATVGDVAAALDGLAARKVTRASLGLAAAR